MTGKDDDGIWFEQRRYGLGVGLPVAWQGWLMMALHVAVIVVVFAALRDRPAALVAAMFLAALLPLPLYGAHVRGRIRWRWGGDD